MFASAKEIRRDIANAIKAPRRMRVSEAVAEYMRVPLGGGNSVKWDKHTAAYMLEPMDCLNSREYDAVIFVGPARTGKTIGLIDGWITYSIICDPSDFLLVQLTQEKASEHSRKRLDRTFRCSPEIAKRLSPRKTITMSTTSISERATCSKSAGRLSMCFLHRTTNMLL